jgi:predicted nucleic acid-binding protein
MVQARAVLNSVILLTLSTGVCERAASLELELLRSLDALHLAAAMELGDELEAVVTFDERLTVGAHLLGLGTVAPA